VNRFIGIYAGVLLFLSLALVEAVWADEIKLTPAEAEFIRNHGEIRLGVDPQFVPYEFIDSDGEYEGVAADYVKLINEKTGLNMVVVKDLTWDKAYEMAVQKEIDVLPCVSKTTERENYFLFSEPYYEFKRVIYVSLEQSDIKQFEDLAGKRIAVQVDSSHHSYLKCFPEIELSLYSTVEEALWAVSSGKEIAFVGNLATSNYILKERGITHLKYIEMNAEERQHLYFAVRNDWPELVSIINKGLALVTKEEKITINNYWLGVEKELDYSRIIKVVGWIGAVIALIFLVSAYWIMRLRREIRLRRQTESELFIAKEEAVAANHIKSAFLARMSHEIRTPLNAITGMTYLIKKTEISPTQRLYLEKILQASHNMLGIINDILDFSKIEAGKIEIEHAPFNLDKVLQRVIDLISFRVDEQNIDFSLTKDSQLPTFYIGDPTRIEQVLLNLMNNAIKFTKDGEVDLTISQIAVKEGVYTVKFVVGDTGIGMTKAQLAQLFTPFDQGDSSITRRFGGTGLGLTIVKSLVEMMGGEISVESFPGRGSTFTIQLDLEMDARAEAEDRKKAETVSFQDINALVVEKNKTYTNLLQGYLRSFKVEASFANSETEAAKLIAEREMANLMPFNLLIVDADTPLAGGIEYATQLMGYPQFQGTIKTVLIVPLAREDLFEKLEEAGIDFGIAKPIIPSVLYNGLVEIFKAKILEYYDVSEIKHPADELGQEQGYGVLIVEDNKTNQFIAQSILEQAGFTVHIASDGQEGYTDFLKYREELDVILMDLHMPVMGGLESASLIRKTGSDIPIIAMTADAIAGVEDKCLSYGINHYISKPFDPDKFVDTILRVVRESAASQAVEVSGENEIMVSETDMVMEKMLDEADGLRRIGGNKELYGLVLREFFNENQDVARALQASIDQNGYEEAIQIVHKIKSSSGNVGAKRLAQAALELQSALSKNDSIEIAQRNLKFQNYLGKTLEEIDHRIK
jgi:signal transduction histidine kinase/DNA-binding response OmpR family regulator